MKLRTALSLSSVVLFALSAIFIIATLNSLNSVQGFLDSGLPVETTMMAMTRSGLKWLTYSVICLLAGTVVAIWSGYLRSKGLASQHVETLPLAK